MILDKIENAEKYVSLSENLKRGFKYLQEIDWLEKEPGEYELEGRTIFAIVSNYNTKPYGDGRWEAHRKYYDIQYVADGSEAMGYAELNSLNVDEEYNGKTDMTWLTGEGYFFQLDEEYFTVFGPNDAHMPAIILEESEPVKKVIIKVLID